MILRGVVMPVLVLVRFLLYLVVGFMIAIQVGGDLTSKQAWMILSTGLSVPLEGFNMLGAAAVFVLVLIWALLTTIWYLRIPE